MPRGDKKELESRRILGPNVQHDNTLHDELGSRGVEDTRYEGIHWPSNDVKDKTRLDLVYISGTYSIDYLKTVIWWMENMQIEKTQDTNDS